MPSRRSLTPLTLSMMVAVAAVSVSACEVSDNVITSIGMATSATVESPSDVPGMDPPPRGLAGGPLGAMDVTPKQRSYLDALASAGVAPSSELLALSIGAYVCQAHAASQSDQAVWDFVLPMVRDDVRDSHPSSEALPAGQVNSVTADYIRIATERLC
ncbi:MULTISPECIES: DUF732 domain-containing protein [unclassified Mycolicibacterium]|uniref:DUF732 domain-containing protein n=1 Tax=unclassified Mycolicibacterium TaxID=2636767 RepID=UPI001F4C2397|nr:DUF732 domain-containing protein [Mycolicibacterium sp. YH-1]UNB53093.1 DUF732 domain-containing protein [Mycolicibacterium sp. YH-1]